MAEVFDINRAIEEMRIQKENLSLESSSRIANLNQILLQTKQACSQLENRNEELQEQEKMLVAECDTLEKKCTKLSVRLEAPCRMCIERDRMITNPDVILQKSYSSPVIPITTIPELTETDKLKKENKIIRQKYECLLANFQMLSDKSSQLKQELKDNDKIVVELQKQCDLLLSEKEEIVTRYEKVHFELQGSNDKYSANKRKQNMLQEEAVSLLKDLEDIQNKYTTLQEQHTDVLCKLKNMQDSATNLQTQVSFLKVSKAENEQALSSAQSKIDGLINEVENCSNDSDVSTANSDIGQKTLETKFYQEKLRRVEQEKEEISNELVKVTSQFDMFQSQKASIDDGNKMLETKMQNVENVVKKLQAAQKASAIEHDELVKLRSECVALSEKNESILEENRTLLSSKDGSSSLVQDLKKSVTKYQRESKRSWEMVHNFQKDIEKIENDFILAQESLESKSHEYDKLLNEMEQMKTDMKSLITEKAILQEKLSDLHTTMEHLKTSNYELHSRCSDISTANNTSLLSHHQTEEELDVLHTKLKATESVLYEKEHDLNEVKITVDIITQENTKLTSQLDKMSKSLMISNDEIDSLKSKLIHYEHETAAISNAIEELERVHLGCEPTRARFQMEIDRLNECIRIKDKEIGFVKEEASTSKIDLKRLQQYNESLESIVEDLQNKLQIHLEKIDYLSLQMESKVEMAAQYKQQLETKCGIIKEMETEMKCTKVEFDKTRETLREEIEKMEARYYQLQEEYDVLFTNHKQAVSNVVSLEDTIKELAMIAEDATIEKDEMAEKMKVLKSDKSHCQKQAETLQRQLKETQHELRYQKTKLREQDRFVEKHIYKYSTAVQQFKSFRSDALHILSDEATPQSSCRSRRRHLSEDSADILRPVQNQLNY